MTLTASTRGMEGDIKRALNRVDGRGAGRQVGQQFAQSAASSAKFDGLQSKLATAGKLAGKAAGGAAALGIAAVGATIAGALGAAFTKGFERLRTIDDAKFKLKALGNSAGDVQKIMDSALESVKGTAFGLGDAATVAANAVAAGVKPGEELTKYLKMTADASAIAGTELGDMGRIINQVRTGQKAYTEDLNQLADRGIPIYQWLAEEAGVAAGDVKKLAAEGGISAQMFEAAIQKHIGGAALTMGQSFSGSVQNAQAALGRLGAAFLQPVFGNAAGGIGSITDGLDSLTNWITEHQGTIIGFWETLGLGAITMAENFAVGIGGALQALGDLVGGLGNVKGVLDNTMAFFADLRGDHAGAEEFRRSAQEAFGWGEAIRAAGDKLVNADFSGSAEKVRNWADSARTAAAEGRNAHGEIATLGNALGALPPSKDIAVNVTVDEAQRKIDEFFNRNANRTLPVGVNPNIPSAPPSRNPLDVIAGRASGGAISGRGGPKSDVIPIWASNGEHMLSARDVNAMGGQSGVYAFRNALHRAEGGAVSRGSKAGLKPNASQLWDILVQRFPEIQTIGGVRSDPIPDHPSGRALDVMIPSYNTPQGKALGDQINDFIRTNADALGIDSTIWRDTWKDFKGNSSTVGGHQNHIHVKVKEGPATGAKLADDAESTGMDLTRLYADGLNQGAQDAAQQVQSSGPGGGQDFSSLGQSLFSGILQGMGFDGSVFSNPFEWPNVKSGIALANWGGGLLKSAMSGGEGAQGPTTSFAGGGGSIGGLNLPNVTDFMKPLGPAGGFSEGAPHAGTGAVPGPLVQYNGPVNMGVDPRAMTQRQSADMNQAFRRNMTSVRPA